MRDRADLIGAAARAGLTITQIEELPDGTITSRMVFDDPWAAARLLVDLTDQDAGDPVVRMWAFEILGRVAQEMGEEDAGPTLSPDLLAAFIRALHFNVVKQIKFRHEPIETFQSARLTMDLGAGDCDDHARLLVALAKSAGVDAQLIFVDEDDQPAHVVPLLRDADSWWWAETTIDARFGEPPFDALARLIDSGAELGANPFESPPAGAAGIGAFGVVTAGDVAARKTELNTIVQSVETDVIACLTKLDTGTTDAWNAFLAEWDGFYADAPSWLNAGAQGRQASEYADRIRDWQTKLAASCTLSTPVIPEEQDASAPMFSAIKVGALAVALLGAAWIVHDVTGLVPRRARA